MCIADTKTPTAEEAQQIWSLLDRPLSWKQVTGAALTGVRKGLVLGSTVVAVLVCVLLILHGALRSRFAQWREAHVTYDLGGFLHWWYTSSNAGPATETEKRDGRIRRARYAIMCAAYPSSLAAQLLKVLPSHTQHSMPACKGDMGGYQQGLCSSIRARLTNKSSLLATASGAAISADNVPLQAVLDALQDCGKGPSTVVVVTAAHHPPPWWEQGQKLLHELGWVTKVRTLQSQDDEFLLLMSCEALVLCDSAFHLACAAANSDAQVRSLTRRTTLVKQVAPLWKLWPCTTTHADSRSDT